MLTDLEGKGTIIVYPKTCGDGAIDKVENIIVYGCPFQHHFRHTAAFIVGIVIDPTIDSWCELNPVFRVKNDTVDGGGIKFAFHAVENYVADSDFTVKRLSCRFRVDNTREPVDLVGNVKVVAAYQLFAV